jgi:hypothetical protein
MEPLEIFLDQAYAACRIKRIDGGVADVGHIA